MANKSSKATQQRREQEISTKLRQLQVHCYWSGFDLPKDDLKNRLEAHWSKMQLLAQRGSTRSVEYKQQQRMYQGFFDCARDRGLLIVDISE